MTDTPIPGSPESSSELDGRKLELVAALARIVEPLEQSLQKHDANMKALLEAQHMIRKVSTRWLFSTAAGVVVVVAGAGLAWSAFGRLDAMLARQAEQLEQQAEIIEAQKKASTTAAELEVKLDEIPRLEFKPSPSGDPAAPPVVVLRGKTKTSSAKPGHSPPAAKPIEVELEVPTKKRRPKKGNPDK